MNSIYQEGPIIFYWINYKMLLILVNLYYNPSCIFSICQLITNGYILIPQKDSIYPSFYLIIDLISGILSFNSNNNYLLFNLLSYSCIFPVVLIWLMASILMLTYHARHSDYNYRSHQLNKIKNNVSIVEKEINCIITCAICLENIKNIGYTICDNQHFYHQDCIKKWTTNDYGNRKCPTCRQ